MKNLLDFTLEELQSWMKENGESAFRAKQVFSWIYNEVWNYDDMKNIPNSLKDKLKENFYIGNFEASVWQSIFICLIFTYFSWV